MDRFDILRSLLHSSVTSVSRQLKKLNLPQSFQHSLEQVLTRQASLTDPQLTRAMGSLSGLSAITVSSKSSRLRIDATLENGDSLQVSLIPTYTAFAPHGAKEISFRVDPPEMAEEVRKYDLVAAICTEIAHAIWGPFLPRKASSSQYAFVERENDLLRVDLRSVPGVRAALSQRLYAMAVDLIEVKQVVCDEGVLRLRIKLSPG